MAGNSTYVRSFIFRLGCACLGLFFVSAGSVFGAPFATFRDYDPILQTTCGRLPDDAPTGYRVFYDEHFRVLRVLRYENGREQERWESVYNLPRESGVWRRVDHRRGRVHISRAEYGNNGFLIRFTRYRAPQGEEREEYVYDQSGRLMVIKGFRGGALESVRNVRYHPSGIPFMHLIQHSGNTVIGRTVFDTDSEGRIIRERSFLWGRLAKITEYRYCEHGNVIAREERAPRAHENAPDPFFIPPGTATAP
jgi:hypothetical protein